MLFTSVDDAEAYLEAIDVERGAFTAYDAEGRLLDLTTEDIPSPFLFWKVRLGQAIVHIAAGEEIPTHQGDLVQRLRDYLGLGSPPARTNSLTLPALLEQLHRKDGSVL